MRLLGAVLAGGQARRFGSDKALALLDGRTLLDHATAVLAPHVERVVVVGRGAIGDRPGPGLGPLGGVAGALAYAADAGFDAVLSMPCDVPAVPAAAMARLLAAGAPAYLAELPVTGLWPVAVADGLVAYLGGEDRSVRGWARAIGAMPVAVGHDLANINTREDLAALG